MIAGNCLIAEETPWGRFRRWVTVTMDNCLFAGDGLWNLSRRWVAMTVYDGFRRLFVALTTGRPNRFSWYGFASSRQRRYISALAESLPCKWRRDCTVAEIVGLLDWSVVHVWIRICCTRHRKETVARRKFCKIGLAAVLRGECSKLTSDGSAGH